MVRSFGEQFARPEGFLGNVAGRIMARSNLGLNRWVVSLLGVGPDDRVLEIGFGPGVAVGLLAEAATDGLVCGTDRSGAMLRQAERRNRVALREERIGLAVGDVSDAAKLHALGAPFDKVLAVNSVQFWDEPVVRLEELRGLLKSGGLIALAVQPRTKGATDETAIEVGEDLVGKLIAAGFSRVRLETAPMKPVAAACALGTAPDGKGGPRRRNAPDRDQGRDAGRPRLVHVLRGTAGATRARDAGPHSPRVARHRDETAQASAA